MNDQSIAAEKTAKITGAAAKLYETAVKPTLTINPANASIARGLSTMVKSTQDFIAFGNANFEAVTASGNILAAGVQGFIKHTVSTIAASYEDAVATAKAVAATNSVKEVIDLQGAHAKALISKAVSETNKLADASVKLTEQAMAPLTTRLVAAVDTFAKAA
jgi:phasin family protein